MFSRVTHAIVGGSTSVLLWLDDIPRLCSVLLGIYLEVEIEGQVYPFVRPFEEPPYCLPQELYSFTSHQRCVRVSASPYPRQYLSLCLFYYGQSSEPTSAVSLLRKTAQRHRAGKRLAAVWKFLAALSCFLGGLTLLLPVSSISHLPFVSFGLQQTLQLLPLETGEEALAGPPHVPGV